MALADLFPDDDYKFQLRFERGKPEQFFAPTKDYANVIAERKHWLSEQPQTCATLLSTGEALLEETIEFAKTANGFGTTAASSWDRLIALSEFWEADFLLVRGDADGEVRLHGGCVCFPSSWRLSEKIGHPIEFIHEIVPGLNAGIGSGIHKFLANIKPGIAWLRHNWGLSRSSELNQHPDRSLPRLDPSVCAEEVWVRLEHQALVGLPKTGGILFGIRLENYSLAEVKADRLGAARLVRALKTMPEAMAVYKGISIARRRIVELLSD
jgi:dimethylamine monooxygenase subunit A